MDSSMMHHGIMIFYCLSHRNHGFYFLFYKIVHNFAALTNYYTNGSGPLNVVERGEILESEMLLPLKIRNDHETSNAGNPKEVI